MAKGIKRQLDIALHNVNQAISGQCKRGYLSAAMSTEGYAGGYRQALYDVMAALNDVPPGENSRYWPWMRIKEE